MILPPTRDYYLKRAASERSKAGATTNSQAITVHLILAQEYEACIEQMDNGRVRLECPSSFLYTNRATAD